MKEDIKEGKKGSFKAMVGIVLIITALLVLVNDLILGGRYDIGKIIIIVILSIITINSVRHRWYTGIFFPLAFIFLIMKDIIGIEFESDIAGSVIIVALFLSAGCHLLFKHSKDRSDKFRRNCEDPFRDTTPDSSSDVNIRTSFDGISKSIDSKELKSVALSSDFSGIQLDFKEAQPLFDKVELNVDCTFSGIELFIPKNWKTEHAAECIAAGIEDKDAADADSNVTLVIRGRLKLSGIKIIRI